MITQENLEGFFPFDELLKSSIIKNVLLYEAATVWLHLAKFRHFGKSLPVFGIFLTVHFLLGKILIWLWQICGINGLIFTIANVQLLKKI